MAHKGILPPSNDGWISVSLSPVLIKNIFCSRIELIFINSGFSRSHSFHNSQTCNISCFGDKIDFFLTFYQSHRIQYWREVLYLKFRKTFIQQCFKFGFTRCIRIPRICCSSSMAAENFISTIITHFSGA